MGSIHARFVRIGPAVRVRQAQPIAYSYCHGSKGRFGQDPDHAPSLWARIHSIAPRRLNAFNFGAPTFIITIALSRRLFPERNRRAAAGFDAADARNIATPVSRIGW